MDGRRPEAALLDRDGTINVKAPEGEYVTSPGQLQLLPGAARAIRALNEAHVPVIVVTNQRGIALGRMAERDLAAVHARLTELLREQNASLDGILHCPHDRGVCTCRKPGTLMLRRAQTQLGLTTLHRSVMIGDAPSDALAGLRVGARTVMLADSAEAVPSGAEMASSLLDAVGQVL